VQVEAKDFSRKYSRGEARGEEDGKVSRWDQEGGGLKGSDRALSNVDTILKGLAANVGEIETPAALVSPAKRQNTEPQNATYINTPQQTVPGARVIGPSTALPSTVSSRVSSGESGSS
jgi:hypothetical protein